MIDVKDFGKDHWSLLAYFETCEVDKRGFFEKVRMRINTTRHPAESYFGQPRQWKDEYGTKVKAVMGFPVIIKGHDDLDCAEDLEAAGFLKVYIPSACKVALSDEGRRVCNLIREHKAKGGYFANFELEPQPKKKSTNMKELRSKNPIRKGQRWKKKEGGMFMTIDHKDTDDCWKVVFDSHSRRATHTLKERDIYRYYELV